MQWDKLLTTLRFGQEEYGCGRHDGRSEFQRDYDRLIFSAPFRRLQNKTQVFPLPGSVFVHNRLTHSLEVSCVGRSLGNAVISLKRERGDVIHGYLDDIGSIVATACLAHDLGNPPFGHSGEKAIATFFSEGEGQRFESWMSAEEWCDFIRFEGNANAFRLLTHQFNGRRRGGFVLTYSTLASVVKYPYASCFSDPKKQKFGFFTTETAAYERIAEELGILRDADNPNRYVRHPLVYLVEAADDICYQLMDIEDAFKLRILGLEETCDLLLGFLTPERQVRAKEVFDFVTDDNEKIAYLRSSVMGQLIDACAKVFVHHEEQILAGTFKGGLIDGIEPHLLNAYKHASKVAFSKVYRSHAVLDVELGGYQILTCLLNELVNAVFEPEKAYSKQLLLRIPEQYNVKSESAYERLQAVLDYVSGMTDVYALDLYRKIKGLSLPGV